MTPSPPSDRALFVVPPPAQFVPKQRGALALTLALVIPGTIGCAITIPGELTSALTAPANVMTPLPFTPTIQGRTNDRTDGTSFEPCNAYTADEVIALGINPVTIQDAAKIDAANYRGCDWRGSDYTPAQGGSEYTQVVGLEMSLAEYKRYFGSLPRQADRTAHGRKVAVVAENNYCTAAFESGESIVTTIVAATRPSPGNVAECDRAIAFASLAITKAPQ